MSIMPNEPPVRVAPASRWNPRNDLGGVKAALWDKKVKFFHPSSLKCARCKVGGAGWVGRGSPAYNYNSRLSNNPSLLVSMFEADETEMSHGVSVSWVMNSASFNDCISDILLHFTVTCGFLFFSLCQGTRVQAIVSLQE